MRSLLKSFNVEKIAQEVMSNLIIKDIDMYFVVEEWEDEEEYHFLGMAYSAKAARKLADAEDADGDRVKIIRFDMGKLVTLIEKLGGTELCERENYV